MEILEKEKVLYLTVGKEVSLLFEKDHFLKEISLSVNKLGELLRNQLVDKESIFNIDKVCLITRSNYITTVRVVTGAARLIEGESDLHSFSVNKRKTKANKKDKSILHSGRFVFFIDPVEKLTKDQFFALKKVDKEQK